MRATVLLVLCGLSAALAAPWVPSGPHLANVKRQTSTGLDSRSPEAIAAGASKMLQAEFLVHRAEDSQGIGSLAAKIARRGLPYTGPYHPWDSFPSDWTEEMISTFKKIVDPTWAEDKIEALKSIYDVDWTKDMIANFAEIWDWFVSRFPKSEYGPSLMEITQAWFSENFDPYLMGRMIPAILRYFKTTFLISADSSISPGDLTGGILRNGAQQVIGFMNGEGKWVDRLNRLMDHEGSLVDEAGNALKDTAGNVLKSANAQGQLIDEAGNVLKDKAGNILMSTVDNAANAGNVVGTVGDAAIETAGSIKNAVGEVIQIEQDLNPNP